MSPQRLLTSLLAAAAVVSLAGCGVKYQPVAGQLVFTDGAPVSGLEGGQVIAQPTNGGADGKTPSGAIDSQGKFTLGTDGLNDGAPEGEYQLIISLPQPPGDVPLPKVIDPKYTKLGGFAKSYTVKTGKNEWQVEVEKAPTP